MSESIRCYPKSLSDFIGRKEDLSARIAQMDSFEFMAAHSNLLDDYFASSFSEFCRKSRILSEVKLKSASFALVALGGYGRLEQCVHSDIDLLFLFEEDIPDFTESLIEDMVYPLWDIGMNVSHLTHRLEESIGLARQDFPTLTSLLDARFISGDISVFNRLTKSVQQQILERQSDEVIRWLIESNQRRHRRFGDSAYLLEPNLKEGRGGLRDYHTILWIARIKFGVSSISELKRFRYFSNHEYSSFHSALLFIFKIRNFLHAATRRKCDRLYMEHQPLIAELMCIDAKNGHLPVEQLLGELHLHMECIKQHHLLFLYEMEYVKRSKKRQRTFPNIQFDGLIIDRGMLNFSESFILKDSPHLILLIFYESATKKVPLHPESVRIIRENPELVDNGFRSSHEYAKIFEKILLKPSSSFNVLNQMLHSGFLVQYIPEFNETVNRIQFDQYHLYPVARHLLSTVRVLKEFSLKKESEDDLFLGKLFRRIRRKRLLIWAALLHDIGKASPESGHAERGAIMVQSILSMKGLPGRDIEMVVFLVRHHLLLIETATRRDIRDEETCVRICQIVKDKERLTMLYLLTVADSIATGPKAFNQWTASLLKSLFMNVMTLFEGRELTTPKAVRTVSSKKMWLKEENERQKLFPEKYFGEMLAILSPRYLLNVHESDMLCHLKLYDRMKGHPFVWNIQIHPDSFVRTLSICAPDRPGLLSKIAGALTLNNMDILNVRVFTFLNNIALDIFDVRLPEDPYFEEGRWEKAHNDLSFAILEKIDLTAALFEKRQSHRSLKGKTTEKAQTIAIDNDSSSFYTIIEVVAWNYPGLLFEITHAFFEEGLDIWVAKSAIKVDQTVYVFYARDLNGQKIIAPDKVQSIQRAIQNILQ